MRFDPPHCPYTDGPCGKTTSFQYQRRGTFRRRCDGRDVQRYACKGCRRTFSIQTFRFDHRLKRPSLSEEILHDFVSKVTQRQTARERKCTLRTVALRLVRMGGHCRRFHERQLRLHSRGLPWSGGFQLDELETYEHNRRLKPLTVPVLVHGPSYCVLHTAVGTLPARKPLSEDNQAKLAELEKREGKRVSESRVKVDECFSRLAGVAAHLPVVHVKTDKKSSYATLLQQHFGQRLAHRTTSSKVPKDCKNPLFAINLTLAMLRDGSSRLVRRTWAVSKKRFALEHHLWVWIAWRNYVRVITNRNRRQSAAMAAGIIDRKLDISDILRWRVFEDFPHSQGRQNPYQTTRNAFVPLKVALGQKPGDGSRKKACTTAASPLPGGVEPMTEIGVSPRPG